MKQLSSAQARQMLDFFQSKGHTLNLVRLLIPENHPTLLWINNSWCCNIEKYFDGSVVPRKS